MNDLCHIIEAAQQVAHPGCPEYRLPQIPSSRLICFENSGRTLMVEEPRKLSQALATFVAD